MADLILAAEWLIVVLVFVLIGLPIILALFFAILSLPFVMLLNQWIIFTYVRVSGVWLEAKSGVDFTRLEELLASGSWKWADEKTSELILKAVYGKEWSYSNYNPKSLESDSALTIPCGDLRIIDSLWVKYSQGRFGFSVQKNIWLEMGGKIDLATEQEKLFERLGWRKEGKEMRWNDLTFNNQKAPIGHLPTLNAKLFASVSYLPINKKQYKVAKQSPYLSFLSKVNRCKL